MRITFASSSRNPAHLGGRAVQSRAVGLRAYCNAVRTSGPPQDPRPAIQLAYWENATKTLTLVFNKDIYTTITWADLESGNIRCVNAAGDVYTLNSGVSGSATSRQVIVVIDRPAGTSTPLESFRYLASPQVFSRAAGTDYTPAVEIGVLTP